MQFYLFFLGLSNSLFHPAASAMVADVTAPEKKNRGIWFITNGTQYRCCDWSDNGSISSCVVKEPCVYYCLFYNAIFMRYLYYFLFKRRCQRGQIRKNIKKRNLGQFGKIVMRDKALMIYLLAGIIISMGVFLKRKACCHYILIMK